MQNVFKNASVKIYRRPYITVRLVNCLIHVKPQKMIYILSVYEA